METDKILKELQREYPGPLDAHALKDLLPMFNRNTIRGTLGRLAREKKILRVNPGRYRCIPPASNV